MGFQIFCNNKGCFKSQEPKLNISTNEVHCSECHGVISNISDFTKRQMKSMGQITKIAQAQEAFSVKCTSCNFNGVPIIKQQKAFCSNCSKEIKISPVFINIIKNKQNDSD